MLYGQTKDAYFSFKKLKNSARHYMILGKYCHALPYAYQGRRMLTEIYALMLPMQLLQVLKMLRSTKMLKEISKSELTNHCN
jgi:hydroxymethylglutaryl-CoA synthase